MKNWLILLGAMLTWTVHFFAGYIVSITIGGGGLGRILVLVISAACLAANAWLLLLALKAQRSPDDFDRWIGGGGLALLLLGTVGILFQTLPALLA